MGGSGCCGRLGGLDSGLCEVDPFPRARAGMERMGVVYRALHEALGDERIELTVVDPRNTVALPPMIYRDARRRRGMGRRDALRQVRRGVGTGAVVVDGKVLHWGTIAEDPDSVVAAVLDELAASP
ncbi:hypothetical protein ER308_20970 [Egibacter rhizosphaerae]|uniref:Uncharacterized protein n=2 Tax=Egibacter rhizosphaerae TaxID=1670831 RepID=A0A411YLV6_9ACTN|nr:hypothetical protein ER308_20970 [Egibacter rhizosphaerae]